MKQKKPLAKAIESAYPNPPKPSLAKRVIGATFQRDIRIQLILMFANILFIAGAYAALLYGYWWLSAGLGVAFMVGITTSFLLVTNHAVRSFKKKKQ